MTRSQQVVRIRKGEKSPNKGLKIYSYGEKFAWHRLYTLIIKHRRGTTMERTPGGHCGQMRCGLVISLFYAVREIHHVFGWNHGGENFDAESLVSAEMMINLSSALLLSHRAILAISPTSARDRSAADDEQFALGCGKTCSRDACERDGKVVSALLVAAKWECCKSSAGDKFCSRATSDTTRCVCQFQFQVLPRILYLEYRFM